VNPIHVFPDASGSYVIELIAYSPLGCTDTVRMVINVSEELIYYVPNTFTPDGDNYNETFKPVFTAGYDPYDFTLLIFNRWGEIIWESHDVAIGWDGTYGGQIMQDGVYTWKIDFKTTASDERVMITGHVTLLK
jgi:gliding motility-associated-like protein